MIKDIVFKFSYTTFVELRMQYLMWTTTTTVTYGHKLKRIGHPVLRSAIHKPAYPLNNSLNRASSHSAEMRPLAA